MKDLLGQRTENHQGFFLTLKIPLTKSSLTDRATPFHEDWAALMSRDNETDKAYKVYRILGTHG